MPRHPKIYLATEQASEQEPVRPLVGTRKSAQQYVDRVTSTQWWSEHCPGVFDFFDPPPTRVWIWEEGIETGGYYNLGVTHLDEEEMPHIVLGRGCVNGDTQAIADKWIILHELAHVMCAQIQEPGHHGPNFIYAYYGLVKRFLGESQAAALAQSCRDLKIRLNYGLLLSVV